MIRYKIIKVIFFRFIILLCFTNLSLTDSNGQSTPSLRHLDSTQFIIKKILFEGNERTKDHIISRELDLKPGDTISLRDTNKLFESNRNKIFNTGLFISVKISITNAPDSDHSLIITVKERWYIFPIPIFELADRNFNEWWVDRNHAWNRVEYGIRFRHENFRGRNERLKIVLQGGFTNKYELFYKIPYITKRLKEGIEFGISYSTNKQMAFQSKDHKLDYLSSEEVLRKRFYSGISYQQRNKFYTTHHIELIYHNNWIHDTIASLNPSFFLHDGTVQRYFRTKYQIEVDKRNIQYYATKGYYFSGAFEKVGLGLFNDVDITNLLGSYKKYWELKEGFFAATMAEVKYSFPSKQPYFNQRGLGWKESLVRGYELYVIDGQNYFLNKSTLRKRIWTAKKSMKTLLPMEEFKTVPYAFYLKLHNDFGYVSDQINNPLNNELSNRLLWGAGFGLDFVTYYDAVLRTEYSFSNLRGHGLFFHFDVDI